MEEANREEGEQVEEGYVWLNSQGKSWIANKYIVMCNDCIGVRVFSPASAIIKILTPKIFWLQLFKSHVVLREGLLVGGRCVST